jgi:uncharacterized membrane protein
MQAEGLIRDYLRRLDAAAVDLPPDRRGELASEVRDHIAAALEDAGSRDEVTVRNVLERLGPPEEIVSAEEEPAVVTSGTSAAATAMPRAGGQSSIGAVEIAALLLLTVGAFALPVVGPLVGLLLVWLSNAWTRRHKIIATVIVLVLLILPILLIIGLGSNSGALP